MKLIIFLIFFGSYSTMAFCQNQMKVIIDKYQHGEYDEVIKEGKSYRNTLAGKGIPALDYMILTSLCMSPETKTRACKISNIILDDYYQGLTKKYISLMKSGFAQICEKNEMPNANIVARLSNVQYAHNQRIAGVSGDLKSFSIISNGFLNQPEFDKINLDVLKNTIRAPAVSIDSIGVVSNAEIDNLISRRCKKNDKVSLAKALKRFGGQTKFYKTSNFLVITSKSNPLNIQLVGDNLEKVINFYRSYYSLDLPDELIVVNLPSKFPDVKASVERIYNTEIHSEILGYSNKFDNNITAWVPSYPSIGTVKHELIHILLKSKFDNLPHWFEEGLAELYEESDFKAGELRGKNNWRLSLLQANLYNYPLIDLLHNAVFSPSDSDKASMKTKAILYIQKWDRELYNFERPQINASLEKFFTNYFPLYKDALSRYFILYLQETKMLKPLFMNLANRDANLFDIDKYETIDEVVKRSCQQNDLSELQRDFILWLSRQTYAG